MTPQTPVPDNRDPYQILELGEGATQKEIKERYHKLARQYHTDGKSGDAKKIRDVNWAYELLSTPAKFAAHRKAQIDAQAYAEAHKRAEARARRAAERSATQAQAVGDQFRTREAAQAGTSSRQSQPTTRTKASTATGGGSARSAQPRSSRSPNPGSSQTPRSTTRSQPGAKPPPKTPPKRQRVATKSTSAATPPREQPRPPRATPKPPPSTVPSTPVSGRRIATVLVGAAVVLSVIVVLHNANHASSDADTPRPSALSTTSTQATPSSPSPGTSVTTALSVTPGIEEIGNSGTVAYGEGSCGPERGQFWKATLDRGDRVVIVWGGPNYSAMGLDIWPPGTTSIPGSGKGRVAYQSTAGAHTVETFTAPASGVYPIVIDDSCGSPGEFHFRLTAQRSRAKSRQNGQTTSRTQTPPPHTEQHSNASQQREAQPRPSSPPTTTSAPPVTSPQVEGGNQTPTQSKPAPAPSIEGQSPSEGNNGVEGGTQ
jgi:curved DNA-binding protein CbpA